MADLLPCPFCGCEMKIYTHQDWHQLDGDHSSRCPFHSLSSISAPATDTGKDMITSDWNHRAQPPTDQPAEDSLHDRIRTLSKQLTEVKAERGALQKERDALLEQLLPTLIVMGVACGMKKPK